VLLPAATTGVGAPDAGRVRRCGPSVDGGQSAARGRPPRPARWRQMPAKEPAAFRLSEAAISGSMGAKGSRAKVVDLVGDANRLSGRLCSTLWSLSAFGLASPADSSLPESSGAGERESADERGQRRSVSWLRRTGGADLGRHGDAARIQGDTVMRRGWRREQRGGRRLGREPPREGGMSLPGQRLDLGSWLAAVGVGGRRRRLWEVGGKP
jgi:hypothetical protein